MILLFFPPHHLVWRGFFMITDFVFLVRFFNLLKLIEVGFQSSKIMAANSGVPKKTKRDL